MFLSTFYYQDTSSTQGARGGSAGGQAGSGELMLGLGVELMSMLVSFAVNKKVSASYICLGCVLCIKEKQFYLYISQGRRLLGACPIA